MNTADTEALLEITAQRPNPEALVLQENHDSVTGVIIVNAGEIRHAVQYTIAPESRRDLTGYTITLTSNDRSSATWTDEKLTAENGPFFSRAIAHEAESMFKPTIIIPPIPEDK